jgi:hypothetical protein
MSLSATSPIDIQHHCARCHEIYRERDNVGKACRIEHEVFNDEPVDCGGDIYRYKCKSCGEVDIEDGAGGMIVWRRGGICYEGKHAERWYEVDYDGDNTVTCKEKECPVHHCVRCHERYHEVHCGDCIEGVHTTKVENVEYDGDVISTCEALGCQDDDDDDDDDEY